MSILKHLVYLTVIFVTVAQAQEPPPRVKLQLSAYLWQDPATQQMGSEYEAAPPPVELLYTNGQKNEKLILQQGQRSTLFTYDGPAPVTFFKESIGVDGKPVKIPLAIVPVSGDWARAFLFLAPTPGNATPYQALAVKDDSKDLPINHAKIVNLSRNTLMVRAQEKNLSIAPSGSTVVSYAGAPNQELLIKIAVEIDGKWTVVRADALAAYEGTRKILLAYPAGAGAWRLVELGDNGDTTAEQSNPVSSSR